MAYVYTHGDGVESFRETMTQLGKVKKADLIEMVLALQTEVRIHQDSNDDYDEEEIWEKGWHQGKEDSEYTHEKEMDALEAQITELKELVKGEMALRQTIQDCSEEIEKLEVQVRTRWHEDSEKSGPE